MGLKRWTGSGYEDVNLAQHRAAGQYVARTPKAAYVWQNGQYKQVWSASIYPVTGTVGGGTYLTATTLASHTVAENGTFTVDWEVTCTEGLWSPRINLDTVTMAAGSEVAMQGTTPVSWTGNLNAGHIINFRVTQSIINTVVVSGTWSITKH